jgi:type III secretion protein N (ATPase)
MTDTQATAPDPHSLDERLASWSDGVDARVAGVRWTERLGRVVQVVGTIVEARIDGVKLGELCELVRTDDEDAPMLAEVVGFTSDAALLSALMPLDGVSDSTCVRPLGEPHRVTVPADPFGTVLDGFGRLLMRKRPPSPELAARFREETVPVIRDAPDPTQRPRISEPMYTGVRSVDALVTLGYGQRVGIFAGAGSGKTTLLAAIARGAQVDAIVFGLVGERGRELREFLEHELDEALVAKSVIVCATSDRTSMERARAAFTATAIAECLRDRGMRVLLLIDSLTRFARAQREIGLAAGEPPARGGFPPSVYTMLPRLSERCGNTATGSITGIYTVLVEGEETDPIGEEVRSLLDGHIILSRKLGEKGHYPAVDPLASLSRIMRNVVHVQHYAASQQLRALLARYKELELLIRVGEFKPGQDPMSDLAVMREPRLMEFLRQDTRYPASAGETLRALQGLLQ